MINLLEAQRHSRHAGNFEAAFCLPASSIAQLAPPLRRHVPFAVPLLVLPCGGGHGLRRRPGLAAARLRRCSTCDGAGPGTFECVEPGAAHRLWVQPRCLRMRAQQLLAGRVGGATAVGAEFNESDAGASQTLERIQGEGQQLISLVRRICVFVLSFGPSGLAQPAV